MGKGCVAMENLKFYVRILPCDDFDWDNIKIEDNNKTIYVRCLNDLKIGRPCNVEPFFWCFKTDGVFYNTGQEDIYYSVMEGILKRVYEGIDSVVISHGQTCSGKSFTMCALRSMYEYRGIIPRFIHDLFLDIKSKFQDWKVNVSFSYVEFHGNKVTDLLRNSRNPIKIKEVSKVKAKSEEELLSLLFKGERQRDVEKSAWYIGAHRATTVITFHLECLSLLKSCAVICRSKVHFVDIAGIETVGKRNLTSFKNAHEQGMANKCKSFLEHLLMQFKGATNSVTDEYKIKRRSCGMLEYLGTSVSPACILRLIGHIRPTFPDLEVSLSTLKLCHRTRHSQPLIPKYNIVPHFTLLFKKFKEELESKNGTQDFLKRLLSEPSEMESGNISKERVEQLERLLQSYMDGKVSELSVIGNAEMALILQILRNLYLKKVETLENLAVKEAVASRKKSIRSTTGSMRGSELSTAKFESIKPASLLHKSKRTAGSKLKSEQVKEKMVDSPLVAVAEEPSSARSDDEIKALSKLEVFADILIPSSDSKELWSDFLIENGITAEHLENLARLTREKRLLLEIASAEYSGIRSKLEKLRLHLKLSTMKRRKILINNNEHRPCENEKEPSNQELSELENEAKCSKELLEIKFNDWVDVAKEFMEEKYSFREKFEEYCKYIQHSNFQRKINGTAVGVPSSKEEETAREYFYSLQKKLRK
ncbi:kinesin-like protein KIF9 isoform X2 [Nilaparvata lugens]|uniref:kinesin-like protein KIF9 isoform X2 n=1 Tax=Nilaparvata lugens TaxID=108931 RepID=UPI00193C9102|nr:kinesin-like protein KIF9 isoform X2 [Nilaparvata lugens]